jgi:hypothetical protein
LQPSTSSRISEEPPISPGTYQKTKTKTNKKTKTKTNKKTKTKKKKNKKTKQNKTKQKNYRRVRIQTVVKAKDLI